MDQVIICNVKGVIHADGPTENYHLATEHLGFFQLFL